MRIYLFPPSGRVVGIVALNNYLALGCELVPIDLGRGDQRTPEYAALNANRKMPTLEDGATVLWESNAILFYMASRRPERGLWPAEIQDQADVLRWLCWQSAHWDAESVGMVSFEKASKLVLGLGPADPAFIARGEQNFGRFAAVLNDSLQGRRWLAADRLTIADFAVAGLVPSAERMGLPVTRFPELCRWYEGLTAMAAWRDALAARDAAMASLVARMAGAPPDRA